MCESRHIYPRECRTSVVHLFNHDPSARFLYNGVSTPPKLGEQRRFAAARAARNHDEPIHTNLLRCHCVAPCMSYGTGDSSLLERAGTSNVATPPKISNALCFLLKSQSAMRSPLSVAINIRACWFLRDETSSLGPRQERESPGQEN